MANRAHDISMSRWLLVLAVPLTSAASGSSGGEHPKGAEHCVTADQGSVAWGQTQVPLRLNLDAKEMARLEERLDSGDYPDATLKNTNLTLSLDLLCRNMTRSQAARLLDRELQEAPWSQASPAAAPRGLQK